MTAHDIGYSVPFSALALKPFAVPEKESAGPLNFLLVELPAGVAGAGNGYGVVTTPVTPSALNDDDRWARWPAGALTYHTAPPSISVPWEVLERAEHAALSMITPPSSAYIVPHAEGHALLVIDRFTGGREEPPPRLAIPIPDGLPTSPAFLRDPQVLASEWAPDGHAYFDAKFLVALTGLGKKVGVNEVHLEIREGGPTTIAGRLNTGARYFASLVPALLTERDERGRSHHRVAFDEDDGDGDGDGDVVEATFTEADRAGADPRPDHAMGSGMPALPNGTTATTGDIWQQLDDDGTDGDGGQ